MSTSGTRFLRTAFSLVLTAIAALVPVPVQAQEIQRASEQAVIDRAKAAVPIRELYEVHPEAKPDVTYSDQFGCWVVTFSVDGREVGFATVSPDAEAVLEARFEGLDWDEGDRPVPERSAPRDLLDRLRPRFEGGGLFWLAALVLLLTFYDFEHPLRWRNVDGLALLLLSPFLLILWDHPRAAFQGIAVVTVLYLVRVLIIARRPPAEPAAPNLGTRPLAVLLGLAFLFHLDVIARRPVDDSGIWGTFGAQHVLAHGQMPYGREDFGGGDTYGPLFYVLHTPFVMVWPPGYETDDGFHIIREGLPEGVALERLAFTAAKLVSVLADGLILLGLVWVGRRWRDVRLGLGLAVVYAILPYTIDGLNFSSHIVATAATVWALVWIDRPMLSGTALALGVGSLFYPVFLLPMWFSFYRGGDRLRFGAGVAGIGFICLALVLLGDGDLSTFLSQTWGNQEGVGRYGSSELGFWGQHPEWDFLKRPVFVVFLLGCLALVWWPGRRTEHQLVALSAAVLLGVQLWKTHMGGHYVEWYLPWLILAVFGGRTETTDQGRTTTDRVADGSPQPPKD